MYEHSLCMHWIHLSRNDNSSVNHKSKHQIITPFGWILVTMMSKSLCFHTVHDLTWITGFNSWSTVSSPKHGYHRAVGKWIIWSVAEQPTVQQLSLFLQLNYYTPDCLLKGDHIVIRLLRFDKKLSERRWTKSCPFQCNLSIFRLSWNNNLAMNCG